MDSITVCDTSTIEACLAMASARAVRLSPSVEKRNWNWNSCAGRGRNLKVCQSAWLFTSTWYARVVCSLELLRGELSRGYTGLNSDPGNDSFSDKIRDAKHVDRSTHYSTCRSTHAGEERINWPMTSRDVYFFGNACGFFESESSFGAYVCHRRPGGSMATAILLNLISLQERHRYRWRPAG